MKYFAYGSNMLLARIRGRVPSARVWSVGKLLSHKLMWHKISADGSGKCDAYETGNDDDILYGVIFEISEQDKPSLDMPEGLGYGYDEKIVPVYSEKDQSTIEAVTYYATNIQDGLQPYHWYKNFVLEGAIENELPEEHIEHIRRMESKDDTDQKRTTLNENILSKTINMVGDINDGISKVSASLKNGVGSTKNIFYQGTEKTGSSIKNVLNKTKDSVASRKISSFTKEQCTKANEISGKLSGYLKDKSSKYSSSLWLAMLSQTEILKVTEAITKSSATMYDKAMDMEYLKTHIGGGNHRIFDGGHTISGAWEKVASATDDDSFSQEVIGYVSGMWKDVTTTKGLPFFNTSTDSYSEYASWVKDNIPYADKEWAYDLLNYDALEILSVCISSASLVFAFKDDDIEKFSEILGRMSVISIASANPIMMISIVFFTAYSYFLHKNKLKSGKFLSGASGSIVSIATFSLLTFLGAGFIVKIGFTVVATSILKDKLIDSDKILILITKHKPDRSLIKPDILQWLQIKQKI